jgi:hypothetical protein
VDLALGERLVRRGEGRAWMMGQRTVKLDIRDGRIRRLLTMAEQEVWIEFVEYRALLDEALIVLR